MVKPSIGPILEALYRYADPQTAQTSAEQDAANNLRGAITEFRAAEAAGAEAAKKGRRKKRAKK